MIESEAAVRIYSDTLAALLGAKVANGKLIRVSKDGYYEVMLAPQGGN